MFIQWVRHLFSRARTNFKRGGQLPTPRRRLRLELLEDRLAPANVAIVSAGLGGLDFPAASVLDDLRSHNFTVYLAQWNSPVFTVYDGANSPADEAPAGNPGSFGPNFGMVTIGPFQVKALGNTLGIPQISVPIIPPRVDVTLDLGVPNTSNDFVQEGLSLIHPGDHVILIGHSLGGDSVLRLARAAAQQNIHIDVLATLDPVGFDNIASSQSPILNALTNLGLEVVHFQVLNGTNNGESNDNGQVPGFRLNTLGAGGGLGTVPANVGYFYNRWQTNAMFPLDFGDSGHLDLDNPAGTIGDQGVQNTTERYKPDEGNPLNLLAYVFGRADLNPFSTRRVFGVNVPTLNDNFDTSFAQLHWNLPQNSSVTSQLTQLFDNTLAAPILASSAGSVISIKAGSDSSHVTVTIDNGPPQSVPITQNQILVDGQGGNDKLILDFSSGNFIAGNTLVYDGGGGHNTLVLQGGNFSTEAITAVDQNTSTITLDSGTIQVNEVGDGLTDPAGGIVDLVPAAHFTFQSFAKQNQTFSVVDGDVDGGFQTTLIRADPQFIFTGPPPEPFIQVDFANKLNAQIVGSQVDDTITVANPHPAAGLQNLIIDPGLAIGTDTVNVLDTASTVNTVITSSGGSDLVTIGRGSPSVLAGIQGPLTIDNPAAFTDLVIDDSGDPNAATNVSITASQVTGLSQGTISYTQDDLASLTVKAGSGGNTITVAGTPQSQFRGSGGTPQTKTTLQSGSGDDTITVQGTGGPLDVQGQDGNDALIGPDTPNTWHVTSNNAGDVNNTFTFSGIENLTGGSKDDTFQFSNGVGVDGVVDGGSGTNTLDYSKYAANNSITVNLQDNSATGINAGAANGFTNIQDLVGGSGSDTLVGPDTANTWDITAANAGDVNGSFSFTSIENLTGGAKDDTFRFSDGAGVTGVIDGAGADKKNTLDYSLYAANHPITVNLQTGSATGIKGGGANGFQNIQNLVGGAGSDTLVGPDATNSWHITANNKGDVNGTFTFASIEDLTGGAKDDTFQFSDGVGVNGVIDGGAATTKNTLDYSKYTSSHPISANLQTSSATGINGGAANGFKNIQNVVGGAGADTLVGADTLNTWHITSNNAGDVNASFSFSSIEDLTGGAKDDTFQFSNGVGVSGVIDGGGATTKNTLDYSNYTAGNPITVNLQTSSATGINGGAANAFKNIQDLVGGAGSDTLVGADTINTWHITSNNAGDVNGSFSFSSIENLTGGAKDDIFQFSDGVGVSGVIDGAGGKNTIDYSLYADVDPVSVTLATLHSGLATGTGGFKNIQVALGGKGRDTLTGNDADNTWNISADSPGHVVGTVGNSGDTFVFASFEKLIGGKLKDVFNVSLAPLSAYAFLVDGGLGSNTLNVFDVVGGAVIHNHNFGPGFGTVVGSYLTGSQSFIDYLNMANVATDPDADHSFVQALYHQFSNRDGSKAEINSWVAYLHATGSRAAVANAILRSPEARTLVVKNWYVKYLGRAAQGGEEQGWVAALLAGHTEEEVLSSMLGTIEYFAQAGFSNAAFIQNVFQKVLGRSAGAQEVFLWDHALRTTVGRGGAVWLILDSLEYRTNVIGSLYAHGLGRDLVPPLTSPFHDLLVRPAPTAQEIAGWVFSQIDLASLDVGFASTQEFFDWAC